MSATKDSIPRPAQHYRLPELLQDIRLLDLLELSGTTVQASALLSLSQPSVSRRYRALARDFGLQPDQRLRHGCRYGATSTMQLLRLGCRSHRLEAGVARIGADLLHHHLLTGIDWLLPVPERFRTVEAWLELVRQGVLDGALVSELELQQVRQLDASDLQLLPVGCMPLALGTCGHGPLGNTGTPRCVLVPHRGVALGLQRALASQGLGLRPVGNSCHSPEQWMQRLAEGSSAIPISPATQEREPWAAQLRLQPLQSELISPVWLVLPQGWKASALLARTLEQLRAKVPQLAEKAKSYAVNA
jgi:hypothetical protein